MAWTEQLSGFLVVLAGIAMTFADDDLGPPISPEEFAAALADPTLTAPAPEGADNLENLEQQTNEQQARYYTVGHPGHIWANGIVPYTIHSAYSARHRKMIARAIAEFEKRTCIRFVPRTIQRDYIHIHDYNDGSCSSNTGRRRNVQYITLSQHGCMFFTTVLHEFMHALGFGHEHNRPDRDQYITVNRTIVGNAYNYRKTEDDGQIVFISKEYDYHSIVHYKSNYGRLTSKKEGITLGPLLTLTELDVMGVNLLYGCKDAKTINSSQNCQIFAKYHWCELDAEYMCKYCANTCKQCVSGCEKPWVTLGNTGCFLFERRVRSWNMARKYCNDMGADLVVLDTMAKRTDILEHMKLFKYGESIKVGATDHSGTWQWLNGNNVTDAWDTGYPDLENDDCMWIAYIRDTDILGYGPCSTDSASLTVCEKIDGNVCDIPCVHGKCIAHNKCECEPWWKSPTCEEFFCDDGICQNGGTCSGPNECTCPPNTAGLYCEQAFCDSECLNGGKCTGPNTCTCIKGFTGSLCGIGVCKDYHENCADWKWKLQCTDKKFGHNVIEACPKTCKIC